MFFNANPPRLYYFLGCCNQYYIQPIKMMQDIVLIVHVHEVNTTHYHKFPCLCTLYIAHYHCKTDILYSQNVWCYVYLFHYTCYMHQNQDIWYIFLRVLFSYRYFVLMSFRSHLNCQNPSCLCGPHLCMKRSSP